MQRALIESQFITLSEERIRDLRAAIAQDMQLLSGCVQVSSKGLITPFRSRQYESTIIARDYSFCQAVGATVVGRILARQQADSPNLRIGHYPFTLPNKDNADEVGNITVFGATLSGSLVHRFDVATAGHLYEREFKAPPQDTVDGYVAQAVTETQSIMAGFDSAFRLPPYEQ